MVEEWGASCAEDMDSIFGKIIYVKPFYGYKTWLKDYVFKVFACLVRNVDFLYENKRMLLDRLGVGGCKYDFVVVRYA